MTRKKVKTKDLRRAKQVAALPHNPKYPPSGAVLRLLLWDSLRPVLAGLALGTVAALLVGRVIAEILYGVSPGDPLALGAAAVLLLGSAGLAALIPTRRAAAVDPAFVLRQS